jgi:hypothetical protein
LDGLHPDGSDGLFYLVDRCGWNWKTCQVDRCGLVCQSVPSGPRKDDLDGLHPDGLDGLFYLVDRCGWSWKTCQVDRCGLVCQSVPSGPRKDDLDGLHPDDLVCQSYPCLPLSD